MALASTLLLTSSIVCAEATKTDKSSSVFHYEPFAIGYWQNFKNSATSAMRLIDLPDQYNVVTIAFASVSPNGNVKFTLQGPPYKAMPDGLARFKDDIKTLQHHGVKVILSLGGMNSYFRVDDEKKANNFLLSLEKIIDEYGFNGVDYDLEGDLNRTITNHLLDVTRTLLSDFSQKGKHLFITLAPEAIDVNWQISQGKYDPLISEDLIDAVSVQLYNTSCKRSFKPRSPCYSPGTQDFIVSQADSTIQTWRKRGIKNPESLYVVGLAATKKAANSGYASPDVVKNAIKCLKTGTQCASYKPTKTYPELGGIMMWSVNWDAKNNYKFLNELSD